jgi:predicted RNA-binding Zn-ribbon protein involved in translation (DUF1610 family)
MWVKVQIDIKDMVNQAIEITKNREVVEIKCPTCWEIIWKYSYNFLKEKQILICDNCKDETKVDISFHVKK